MADDAFFPQQDIVVIAYDNHVSWVVRKVTNALEAIVFNRPYTVPGACRALRSPPLHCSDSWAGTG